MSTDIASEVQQNWLCIMDHTGDTRYMWDPRDKTEVDVARAAFNAAKAKGMVAYTVDSDTGEKTGTVVTKFDKKLGKIIMSTQLQGG